MLAVSLLALGMTTTLSYGADAKQRVDVYAPEHAAGAPVAVFFHGGVWQHGGRADYTDFGDALARRGFVVFVASYRLTPPARWPAQAEDAAAVVALALKEAKRFGGDPHKLVVIGHSAGAQMAAMLAYDPRFLAAKGHAPQDIRALALLSGVFDLTKPLDESQADGGFKTFVEPTFGTDKKALAAASPVAVASKRGVPFLLVTSEHDYAAMRKQTLAMQKALGALGESVTFLDVPVVDHFGIVHADATADAIARLLPR